MKLGVYVHIPFCKQKCLYCDFPSYTGLDHLYQEYTTALCREIAGQGGVLSGNIVDTIYIGGGTPTILPGELLAKIVNCLQSNFKIEPTAEISIEANPGTVDREKLLVLKKSGINRISFGIQTFSARLLPVIGRIHSTDEAVQAVKIAQSIGLNNINIDLMYGLPGQNIEMLQESIIQAAGLDVAHVSVYGLKVEPGTPFAKLMDDGELALPQEETEETMYDLVNQLLPQHNFMRYEISNYAKEGKECRHNLKYWRYQPYVGVGAAAHSFIAGQRLANTANVADYMRLAAVGKTAAVFREKPDTATSRAEFAFLALRTVNGLIFEEFNAYFQQDFMKYYGKVVDKLVKQQLISLQTDGIYLTPTGMKYGNIVFAAFLPD